MINLWLPFLRLQRKQGSLKESVWSSSPTSCSVVDITMATLKSFTRISLRMKATNTFDEAAQVEVLSSLPLQIAMHYNACWAPFWAIGLIVGLVIKMHYLSTTHVVILQILLFITIVTEFIRLFLGYYGNLGEKISALCGFLVTSVILQVPIAAFSVLSSNVPLPLERILCFCHSVFLFIEIVNGFLVMRKITHYQITKFKKRVLEEEKPKTEMIN